MVNFIFNAIKFSPKGRNIAIHLSDGRLSTGDEALLCSVADEGSGIPENELETVFDKFVQRTKTGGTGLGLSICSEIVEAHGGKIWAQSRKPVGVVLNFTIGRGEMKSQLAGAKEPV